jgi:hypothetical protein
MATKRPYDRRAQGSQRLDRRAVVAACRLWGLLYHEDSCASTGEMLQDLARLGALEVV